jgi:hypothetical protein
MSKGRDFRKNGKLRFIHSDSPTKLIIPSDKVNPVPEAKKGKKVNILVEFSFFMARPAI